VRSGKGTDRKSLWGGKKRIALTGEKSSSAILKRGGSFERSEKWGGRRSAAEKVSPDIHMGKRTKEEKNLPRALRWGRREKDHPPPDKEMRLLEGNGGRKRMKGGDFLVRKRGGRRKCSGKRLHHSSAKKKGRCNGREGYQKEKRKKSISRTSRKKKIGTAASNFWIVQILRSRGRRKRGVSWVFMGVGGERSLGDSVLWDASP